jgi:hypothetical protein
MINQRKQIDFFGILYLIALTEMLLALGRVDSTLIDAMI